MKKTIAALLFIAFLAAAPLLATAPAGAQGAFNMSVFPAKVELAVAAGTSQQFVVNVHNLGAEPQTMNIYFMDYSIRANNEFVFHKPGHYSYSCATWLSSAAKQIAVPPGAVVGTAFGVAVPAEAEPGGHYGVIFFERAPQPGSPPVAARPRIGSLALVTVPGEIIRDGMIKRVEVTSSWFWPEKKMPFLPARKTRARVVFYNAGNVHLTVRAAINYTPTFGWGKGKVDLGEITILPKTTRYLESELEDPPLVGSFDVKAAAEYGPSLDVFDTRKEATGSFDVYPISLLFYLIVAIGAVVGAVVVVKVRKRSAKPEGAGKETAEKKASGKKAVKAVGDEQEDAEAQEKVGTEEEDTGKPEARAGEEKEKAAGDTEKAEAAGETAPEPGHEAEAEGKEEPVAEETGAPAPGVSGKLSRQEARLARKREKLAAKQEKLERRQAEIASGEAAAAEKASELAEKGEAEAEEEPSEAEETAGESVELAIEPAEEATAEPGEEEPVEEEQPAQGPDEHAEADEPGEEDKEKKEEGPGEAGGEESAEAPKKEGAGTGAVKERLRWWLKERRK